MQSDEREECPAFRRGRGERAPGEGASRRRQHFQPAESQANGSCREGPIAGFGNDQEGKNGA